VERFFALDLDLPALSRRIDVDPVIHAALQNYWGLRVIRQDPWECLASFILSSYNNIVRLTGMLHRLAQTFGEPATGPVAFGSLRRPSSLRCGRGGRGLPIGATRRQVPWSWDTAYRFPRPERLANVSERALRNCGLGYRAPYLKAAAQAVLSGRVPLEDLRRLEDEPLRQALLKVPGVGEKVVECVMLFGFERASAFPVDVWIGRAMRGWYFRNRKMPDRKIRAFALKHFGPECGWAQQYLYCAARFSSGSAVTPAPGGLPTHRSDCPSEAVLSRASGRARLRHKPWRRHHARAAS